MAEKKDEPKAKKPAAKTAVKTQDKD